MGASVPGQADFLSLGTLLQTGMKSRHQAPQTRWDFIPGQFHPLPTKNPGGLGRQGFEHPCSLTPITDR